MLLLKKNSLEELSKKSGARKGIFFDENFTNIFNLDQLKYWQQHLRSDKKAGDESINSNFIKCCKKVDWDYAIAFNKKAVHLTLQTSWQIGIDFLTKLINQFILLAWHKNIPLGIETNVVVNYIHRLRENLNKSVVLKIICDNYYKYFHSFSKLKARYCLYFQPRFNIFDFGSVTKFIKSKFLPFKIHELPDSIVYKTNIALQKVSICTSSFLRENILKKETFPINDVIKWLPGLSLRIYIFPSLSCLVSNAAVSLDEQWKTLLRGKFCNENDTFI
ncbi:MAG: hypothetical protein KME54_08005 [Tolypothrix brevis GSE-NOS-MK-07-07A]|jgi:hypothetical protein|nr:hypothetical protein [Tolypothrix brevis GSE-NOS-MK-07-07A]